jgi:hypothetical protein
MSGERLRIVGDDAPQQISEDLATLHDSVRRALIGAAEDAVEAALADLSQSGRALHLRAFEVDVVIRRLVFDNDPVPTVPDGPDHSRIRAAARATSSSSRSTRSRGSARR